LHFSELAIPNSVDAYVVSGYGYSEDVVVDVGKAVGIASDVSAGR
jgi:hypothetical protein